MAESKVSDPLFDVRGCLTAEGLAALARAPVGRGPADLAAHVSACSRCQARLLSGPWAAGAVSSAYGSGRARKSRPWLSVGLVLATLFLALLALLITLRSLAG